jgi:hypothetical protein
MNLMIDKTTEGYSATTDEIEGMLRNLCAYALSDPEPLQRYIDLTHQQVLFDGVVAAIRRERGKALGDLAGMGVPLAKVAELAKLEAPQHVKSLMTGAGVAIPKQRKPPARKAPEQKAPEQTVPEQTVPEQKAPELKVAEQKAPAGKRAGFPMLPPTIVPAEKRTLTPDERRALGLPDPVPIHRKRSMVG